MKKKRKFPLPESFVFKYTAIQFSFLALLLIVMCIMSGCVDSPTTVIVPNSPPTVKVGLILPVELRISTQYGAELAVSQINHQEGGVLGSHIELVVKDNKDDSKFTAWLAEKLVTQDEVVAIIGPNFSRNALQIAPVAQRYHVPMVATTATNPDITEAGDFVFLAAFTDTFQGEVMARFARESLRAGTAALLTEEEDPYSEGLSKIFEEDFKALGGKIVARETYSEGDTDFTNQLTAIAKVAPDVVFMPGFVPEVPLAIKQARTTPQKGASGITATFLGGDGWDDPDLMEIGGSSIEGSYFSNFFSPETQDEDARVFVRAYRSMFGISPDGPAAMGYDAVKLVATAMRRANSFDKTAIRDELAATRGYKGATSILGYDENRHPKKSAVIMRIRNGGVQFHKQVEP